MKEFANAKMDKWTLFYTILYIFFSIGMVIFMFNTDAPKFALITLGCILSGAFIFAYFMIPKISLSENAIHVKNAFVNFKISIQDISYVEKVSNLTDTSGGANTESDDSYKKRIALAPSSFSVAGPYESYKFWALTANQNIIDVAVVNKEERTQDIQYAGVVEVYPLIKSGQPATVEILGQVLEILSNKKVRPLTDKVETLAPIQVDYTIDLKYYIHTDDGANANIIQTKVSNAVQDFIKWQYEKLGRDINPSELTRLIVNAGAKRVDIISPVFTALDEFEIGNNISVNIVFDGFEQ